MTPAVTRKRRTLQQKNAMETSLHLPSPESSEEQEKSSDLEYAYSEDSDDETSSEDVGGEGNDAEVHSEQLAC